ncbi:MAG: HEPN domain-containing protein [Rhodospirillaceae bacterium]|nr:HEPN domain-containing protein [Rhodospirillaceae bacterium]
MSRKVAAYLALAREDLAASRTLALNFPRHAAFNVEQAAEKIIKAVLTKEGIVFGAGHHQLARLVGALPLDHPWRADLMSLDKHSPAATALRYPTPGGIVPPNPDIAQITADIAEIELLLPEIADWIDSR